MKNKIFLLDGSAIIYRSYFVFKNRPLINSKGENTSAIFGFLRTLISLKNKFDPDYFAVIQDEKEPTFRHKKYPEYKATRDKMPEDLVAQLEPVNKMLKAANVPTFSKAGYEADDIIGTVANRYSEDNEIIILSSDKDMYQLVNDNIQIYSLSKKKFIGKEGVKKKFGTTPQHVIDILALQGDSSDNVPGVPKIGIKTAQKLINKYGSVENILNNIEDINSKSIRNTLREHMDQAKLSKELVTIKQDVPLEYNLSDFSFESIFTDELFEFCKRYELKAFYKHFADKEKPKPTKQKNVDYIAVTTEDDFENLLENLREQDKITIDLETDDINPINAKTVGISFAYEDDIAYYIPIRHQYGKQLDVKYVLNKLKPIIEDKNKSFIGHNIKFDYLVLQNESIEIRNICFDTMVASYLLNPEKHRHNLNSLSRKFLDHKMIPIEQLIGKGKKQISFAQTQIEPATKYAAEDSHITYRLWKILKNKLEQENLDALFKSIELPLIKVLAYMERLGVSLDREIFKKISNTIGKDLSKLQEKIFDISGEKFNINSTQQLSYILFEKLDLPVVKKTKTGYSTDMEVLTKLAKEHEIAELLIEYRKLKKLQTTYVDSLPKLINRETGRIHSSFNQTVTATGRLSSSDPNLQNIPIKTEIGRSLRKGFVPKSDDYLILSADYSQIELRVMALMSRDENLIETFQRGDDIHTRTASLIFDVPELEVNKNQRREAKTINFGVLYGMGSYSLSQDLNISRKEAKKFIDNYFDHFPKIENYIEETKQFAHKNEYVKTLFGRKRYLKYINSNNNYMRSFAERTAVNMPIQGTSADIIKIAMNRLYDRIKNKKDEIKMIIQIHDELVFEIKKVLLEEYTDLIKEQMENVLPAEYKNIVPITVDIGTGKNWFEAH